MQFNKVSKELEEIKDSTSVLRKRLAEMMNSLLSDLVSDWAWQIIFGSEKSMVEYGKGLGAGKQN